MALPRLSAKCLRIELWPKADQISWKVGCTPTGMLDDPYGCGLRPSSLEKIQKGYGRWLHFLESRGWLDVELPPLARVTVPRLRAYLRTMLALGNSNGTVNGRFTELTMALKVMAPDEDVDWISRPDGATVYSLLPLTRRTLMVPDAGVLFEWGVQMMEEAAMRVRPADRLSAYRDGLLIAMLAARGRRLRSMSLLRVGHELVRRDSHYRIELSKDQVKTNREDRFDLPERLTSYIDRYLDDVRPTMLGGQVGEEALWITTSGKTQSAGGIQCRIRRLSKRRFCQAFGPHRFRYAIATTVALRLSGDPYLGADLLNISFAVKERHYNHAEQLQAGARYAALIERHRRERNQPGRDAQQE